MFVETDDEINSVDCSAVDAAAEDKNVDNDAVDGVVEYATDEDGLVFINDVDVVNNVEDIIDVVVSIFVLNCLTIKLKVKSLEQVVSDLKLLNSLLALVLISYRPTLMESPIFKTPVVSSTLIKDLT